MAEIRDEERKKRNKVMYKINAERGPKLSEPDGKGGSKAPDESPIEALRTSLFRLSKLDTTPKSVVEKIKKVRNSLIVFQSGDRFKDRLAKEITLGKKILKGARGMAALRDKARSEREKGGS